MTATPVTIRPAVIRDWPAVSELWRALDEAHASLRPDLFPMSDAGEPRSVYRSALEDPEAWIGVAEQTGTIVGSVEIMIHEFGWPGSRWRQQWALLVRLYVRPEVRGQGIGRRLFEAARNWASDRGIREMLWLVWTPNPEASRFYRGLGAETMGEIQRLRWD